jgi:hypothetical protein
MTTQEFKYWLLSKGNFIDNEYLDQYVRLIFDYDKITPGYREFHHSLPVLTYKTSKVRSRTAAAKLADEDTSNIKVHLLYKDHCKAHWLLYFCTASKLKSGNYFALKRLVDMSGYLLKTDKITDLSEADFELIQQYMNEVSEDGASRAWSQTETEFLKQHYPIEGQTYCAKALNRSITAISAKANALGLRMEKWWSEADEQFLRQHFSYDNLDFCCEHLRRTKKAIIGKASLLGLSPANLYTEADKQFMIEHYSKEGVYFCAEHLGRTKAAIRRLAKVLGIRSLPQGEPLYCPELDQYFDSIKDASIKLGLSDGNICSVLKGRIKNTKGYTFIKVSKEDYYNDKRKSTN